MWIDHDYLNCKHHIPAYSPTRKNKKFELKFVINERLLQLNAKKKMLLQSVRMDKTLIKIPYHFQASNFVIGIRNTTNSLQKKTLR